MVMHLRTYLSEEEVLSVLDKERRLIARESMLNDGAFLGKSGEL